MLKIDELISDALNIGGLSEDYRAIYKKRLDDIYITGSVIIDRNNPHVYIDPMIDFGQYYHPDDRLVKYKPYSYCSLRQLKEWLGYYSKYRPKYDTKLIKILLK